MTDTLFLIVDADDVLFFLNISYSTLIKKILPQQRKCYGQDPGLVNITPDI
jgi:hypothetical protein